MARRRPDRAQPSKPVPVLSRPRPLGRRSKQGFQPEPAGPARRPRRSRPLPRDWARIRRAVLARDGHACQIAGPDCTTTAAQVDHILPRRLGGTDSPDNLRAVCETCHRRREPLTGGSEPSRDW